MADETGTAISVDHAKRLLHLRPAAPRRSVARTRSIRCSLGKTDTATLTVGDNPPAAVNDSKTVLENASSTAIDVLANDTDADNDTLTVTSVTEPAPRHGLGRR